jgi:energy-coupling factor transporter ATP-binding protein EcfA2
VAAIRKALGDGQFGNRYIANIRGRGYSFGGNVVSRAGGTESGNAKLRHQGKLPVRPIMMVGRESVVGEVRDKLRDERFVTLLGPGGIGKTTIALAVGRAVAEEFGGKVHFVDLESLADPRHVAGAGSEKRLELTLVGDTVNIASRVEAYCRTLDASVLVTGEFVEALLSEGSLELAKSFTDEGLHTLRGCKEPIRLFSVKTDPKSDQRAVNGLVCDRPAYNVG